RLARKRRECCSVRDVEVGKEIRSSVCVAALDARTHRDGSRVVDCGPGRRSNGLRGETPEAPERRAYASHALTYVPLLLRRLRVSQADRVPAAPPLDENLAVPGRDPVREEERRCAQSRLEREEQLFRKQGVDWNSLDQRMIKEAREIEQLDVEIARPRVRFADRT